LAGLWSFVIDDGRFPYSSLPPVVPLAFVVALMIPPLLRAQAMATPSKARSWPRIPLALGSVILLVVAIGVAHLEHWMVGGFDGSQLREAAHLVVQQPSVPDDDSIVVLLVTLMLGWCVFGPIAFWVSIYWLVRSVLPRGRILVGTIAAATLMFFLPML